MERPERRPRPGWSAPVVGIALVMLLALVVAVAGLLLSAVMSLLAR